MKSLNVSFVLLLFLFISIINKLNAQVSQSVSLLYNQVYITFLNDGITTKITLTTLNVGLTQQDGLWVAIGLNDQP